MSTPAESPDDPRLAAGILGLFQGEAPRIVAAPRILDACLDRYECGGYLHASWTRAGRLGVLPPAWTQALARARHKTTVDTLAALAEFRRLAAHLLAEQARFVLLKGMAYLLDLYPDPGERRLTDIDLLIRPQDAGRIARRLERSGFRGETDGHFPDNRRFEMWLPGPSPCRFEFHWSLGLPHRARVDQEEVWERACAAVLEEIPCRRLAIEDAILYHAMHAADHYFGPSLKWAIDLREMLRRWRPDRDALLERAARWRCRAALHLALRHVAKVFPGDVPDDLMRRTAPGRLRAALQRRYLARDPLSLLRVRGDSFWRYPLRCLMLDRAADAVRLTLEVLARPVTRPLARLRGAAVPPWRWRD